MKISRNYELGKFFNFENAKDMPVHRWFYYKESFSPQLVEMLVNDYKKENKRKKIDDLVVLDPFMGCGTTLLTCNEIGIESYGLDVSYLSYFVTKVKSQVYNDNDVNEFEKFVKNLKNCEKEKAIEFSSELFEFREIMPRRNLSRFFKMRSFIESIENEKVKDLALICLISILPFITFIKKDGGVLKIVKKPVADIYKAYRKKAKTIMKDLKEARIKENKAKIFLQDARHMSFEEETFDVIITSPPYLNNVDYSKVYSIELATLAMDENESKNLRKRLFPSFITGKGSYGAYKEMIANAYFEATKTFFDKAYMCLKEGGKIYYNVSNALINKNYIKVDEEVAKIMEETGFSDVEIIIGLIRRTRIENFSYDVRESVVVGKK